MTAFDVMVVGVVALSTVLACWRGFVRVVASLFSWVLAVLAALRFSDPLGVTLPSFGDNPAARYLAAFALILIGVLVVGSLMGVVLSRLVRAVGLGFADRALGGIIGLARGVLIVVLLVLLAGLTALPKQDWWQNALSSSPLTVAALSLRPWLPRPWAEGLDYGTRERRPTRPVIRAGV